MELTSRQQLLPSVEAVVTVKTTLPNPDPDKQTVTENLQIDERGQHRGNCVDLSFPDCHAVARYAPVKRCDVLGGIL